ncbi:MAG: hypothetical protein HYU41_24215 [Candidatus Rokubacteria bacterium]|nr:hypothetical protein [Candidatus Rokubacteria bacterium]
MRSAARHVRVATVRGARRNGRSEGEDGGVVALFAVRAGGGPRWRAGRGSLRSGGRLARTDVDERLIAFE